MESSAEKEVVQYPEIAFEIVSMCEEDQKARGDESDPDAVIAIDQKNTERLKTVVEKIGWPNVSKVGDKASHNAWLLVQHADRNVAFQKHCYELMTKEPLNEVSEVDIAYLYDRICVNEGRPQFFGTQFTTNKYGAYGPQPIEDIENVDKRREQLGLESLATYKENLMKKYNMDRSKEI